MVELLYFDTDRKIAGRPNFRNFLGVRPLTPRNFRKFLGVPPTGVVVRIGWFPRQTLILFVNTDLSTIHSGVAIDREKMM